MAGEGGTGGEPLGVADEEAFDQLALFADRLRAKGVRSFRGVISAAAEGRSWDIAIEFERPQPKTSRGDDE